MRFFETLFYLCLSVLLAAFCVLNLNKIEVNYYWIKLNWPVGSFIVIAFLVGFLIGKWFGWLKGRFSMKRKMLNKMQPPSASNVSNSTSSSSAS